MDSQHFEGCLLANDIELCGIAYALEAAYEGRLARICNLTGGGPLHTWMPAPELPRFGGIEGEMRQPLFLFIATVSTGNVNATVVKNAILRGHVLRLGYSALGLGPPFPA